MSTNSSQWRPTADPDTIVIPGLDTTAPIPDQVEQIDQLITLKLQKIDGQFARIQWLAEHKLLPAVKRYTNGVQPVREAAHFWVQFFEAAAHMRVPRQDDYEQELDQHEASSSSLEPSTERSDEDASTTDDSSDIYERTPPHSRQFDPNVTPSESSFMPGHAAVSSTPATTSKERSSRKAQQTPSWSSSLESSLHRLNEELDGLVIDDEPTASSHSADTQSSHDMSMQPSISPREKGKGKSRQQKEPLLRNVLRQTFFNTSGVDSNNSSDIGIPGLSSPLRQDAAKILARMNPYLPPDTQPSKWDSIVNLSNSRLATPGREKGNFLRTYNEDDSFGSDPGMGLSPPVTIGWALPAKRQPPVRQTPKKEAAARIGRDLISNIEGRKPIYSTESSMHSFPHDRSAHSRRNDSEVSYSYDSDDPGLGLSPPATIDWARLPYQKQKQVFSKAGKGDVRAEASSSISTISSAPSLSRYMDVADAGSSTPSEFDLDSLMRRVGLDFEVKSASDQSMTEQYSQTISGLVSAAGHAEGLEPPQFTIALKTPEQQLYGTVQVGDIVDEVVGIPEDQQDDYNPDLSDSFEDDRPNNTINPSNAFLLASQRRPSFDEDSFGSGDSFSGDEGGSGGGIVHPFHGFGQGYDDRGFDDDSFDDTMHQPAQDDTETVFGARHAQALHDQQPTRPRTSQQLKLLGEDLVEETQGYGYTARSQDSPTPAARGS